MVNDRDFQIWQTYGVRAWPTMVFVDPLGHVIGFHSGEAPFEALDRAVTRILNEHRPNGTVTDAPLDVMEQAPDSETGLAFPGKVLATGDALYIADSGHHRIVETDHDGRVRRVFGSSEEGHRDGAARKRDLHIRRGWRWLATTCTWRIRRITGFAGSSWGRARCRRRRGRGAGVSGAGVASGADGGTGLAVGPGLA